MLFSLSCHHLLSTHHDVMGKTFGQASPRLDDTAHILLTVCACLRALYTIIPSLHLHCPELGPVTGYRWAATGSKFADARPIPG
jgi:hypothetical protein